MDRLRADLRQLDQLDLQKQCVRIPGGSPPQREVTGIERDVLKSALDFGARFDPRIGLYQEPVKMAERPPLATVLMPQTVPVGMVPGRPSVFTLAIGLNAELFAVLGPVAQAGLYGSNKPELGVFLSLGGGWWTNMGAGIGPTLTLIFGPPSDLSGVALGIGCDVRFMTGSIGGLLLFSLPPIRFLGFAIGLAVGPTAIPAFDVTIQVTNTFTRPLLT